MKSTALKSIGEIPFIGHWLSLVTLPGLIAVVNPNWLFTPHNRVPFWDAMIYQGLFRYYFDFASTPPSNTHYFVERISWILPGYALYHVFPPLIANVILHLGVAWLSLFALYGAGRALFGAPSGFVAAILMGSYPWFLRAVGHDYLDGGVIAYSSLTIMLIVLAAQGRKSRFSAFAGGLAYSTLLLASFSWIVFTPVLAVLYMIVAKDRGARRLAEFVLYFAMGAALVMGSASIFSAIAFGRPNFLANSLSFVGGVGTNREQLFRDAYAGYGGAMPTWHFLPFSAVVAGLVKLVRDRHALRTDSRPLLAVTTALIVMYGTFVVMHFFGAAPYLIIYLYMSYLIPLGFLVVGGLYHSNQPGPGLAQWAIGGLGLFAPFGLAAAFPVLEQWQTQPMLMTGFGVLLVFFVISLSVRKWSPMVLGLTFGLCGFMIGHMAGVYNADRFAYYRFYQATQTVITRIDSRYSSQRDFYQFRVWYHQGATAPYAQGIVSIYQAGFGRAVNESPDRIKLSLREGPPILEGDILILSDRPNVLEEAGRAIGSQVNLRVIDEFAVPYGAAGETYQAYLVRPQRADTYNTPLEITGNNVGPIEPDGQGGYFAWTGPGEEATVELDLVDASVGDVRLLVCGRNASYSGDQSLQARVGQADVILEPLPGTLDCALRYEATLPPGTIIQPGQTEVTLNIPTSPADGIFHNGDSRRIGLAIDYLMLVSGNPPPPAPAYSVDLEAPQGQNVSGPLVHESGVEYVWTGPGEDVAFQLDLGSPPDADLTMSICSLATILPPASQISATLNQAPINVVLVPGQSGCPVMYEADIPGEIVGGDEVSDLRLTIPTAPVDLAFHNGDQQLLGIAISYIRFEIQEGR